MRLWQRSGASFPSQAVLSSGSVQIRSAPTLIAEAFDLTGSPFPTGRATSMAIVIFRSKISFGCYSPHGGRQRTSGCLLLPTNASGSLAIRVSRSALETLLYLLGTCIRRLCPGLWISFSRRILSFLPSSRSCWSCFIMKVTRHNLSANLDVRLPTPTL